MEWVALILALALSLLIGFGVLAAVIVDFGAWTTLKMLAACASVAFLSAVVTLGIQQL